MRSNTLNTLRILLMLVVSSAFVLPAQAEMYDRSKVDPKIIKQGRALYLKNCMVCHGFNAEGGHDWTKRDEDGNYPPPPLNGTGHAWHHSMFSLKDTIKHGTLRLGGKMPPWNDKLSDAEIESIIHWFKSKWPDQLYEAWVRTDKRDRNNK